MKRRTKQIVLCLIVMVLAIVSYYGLRISFIQRFSDPYLYCRGQHGKWHVYEPLSPTADFGVVLQEIKSDPTGIFWG